MPETLSDQDRKAIEVCLGQLDSVPKDVVVALSRDAQLYIRSKEAVEHLQVLVGVFTVALICFVYVSLNSEEMQIRDASIFFAVGSMLALLTSGFFYEIKRDIRNKSKRNIEACLLNEGLTLSAGNEVLLAFATELVESNQALGRAKSGVAYVLEMPESEEMRKVLLTDDGELEEVWDGEEARQMRNS